MTDTATTSSGELIDLARNLRSGALSVEEYLGRLQLHFDPREGQLRAFLPETGRFDRLRDEAKGLQFRYQRPEERPPLYGVPVGIKDIFHVDGYPTKAGSRLPEDELGGQEAACVSLLKEAGALILGKTVTTEFAYFAPGPTHNPHHPEHTPGGSSSGSAAAVGAGLAPLALGTQTIGSITRPAAFCGVVGFKPSRERISREGVIPLSPSLDHIGYFTADVGGAELVASLLVQSWSSAERKSDDARPILGVPVGPYLDRASPEGQEHFEAVCEQLDHAGYRIERIHAMPDFEQIVERHNLILAAEAAQVHKDWYSAHGSLYHPKTAELIRRGANIDPAQLSTARNGRQELLDALTDLMKANDLDLWIAPSAPGPAPKGLESTGDPIMNLPWTHCGLPTLNIPSGFNPKGLPLGTQLAGRWSADEQLFAWAVGIEAVLNPAAEAAA